MVPLGSVPPSVPQAAGAADGAVLAKGLEFALAAGRAEASEKDLEKARKEIALAGRLG